MNGTCTVTNSTIYGNSATSGGGGTYSGTNMTVQNCTIAGNSAGFYGGGVENSYGDKNPISRSIIVSNTNGSGIYTIVTAQTISCSDVYGNVGGNYAGKTTDQTGKNNNISVDPSFCDATGGDYHIYDTSPCAPAQSSCGVLIGALDVGCRIAPNLVIARVEFSKASPAAHESVIATLTLKNTGVAAADSVIIDFYKNRQSAPGAAQAGDERFRAGALAVGDSIVWATSPFTSDTIGTWRSWFAVDADRRVVETNENDNVSGPHVIGWRIPNKQGWPIAMGAGSSDSSPLLVNLDSDPGTLEVVLGGCGGNLCVWGADGEPLPGWPVHLPGIIPSPAAGDITGDSGKEIVVCTTDNKLHALDASGNELWQVLVAQYGGLQGPVVADLDGDGKLEILVAHDDATFLYEGDGSPFVNPKIIFPGSGVLAPAVGDIDDDGNPEIVSVGTHFLGTGPSQVLVTRADGLAYFHWPIHADTIDALEPVIGDITSDHRHMEIVVVGMNGDVDAWSYNGSRCFTHGPLRVPGVVWSAPALADVNRDGYQEIIVTSTKYRYPIGDVHDEAYVTVIRGDGVVLSSKTIADWYGLGHVIDASLVIGRPARAIVRTPDNTIRSDGYGFPLSFPGLMMAGPAAGDIDGDGWVELVSSCEDSLYCFELCSPAYPADALWWPLSRRNAERTACYG